jgi:threonine dehydratase
MMSLLAQTRKLLLCDTREMETADRIVSLDDINAARERIAGLVHRTPMFSSSTAAQLVGQSGGPRLADDRLYVKAEHLQKTGSFKARGLSNRVATLTHEERSRGIITLSAGNAAQAYAWAGRAAGIDVTVVMPAAAVRSKVDACLDYGAEVVLHGANVGETFTEMQRLAEERHLVFVHPFDDPEVIAGHGSVGLEIIEDVPDVDVVVVGVGGGGLISGIAGAIKQVRPATRVYGIEPEGANAVQLAMAAGAVVRMEPHSVADGLAAPFAGEWTLAMCRRFLDGLVIVDDPTILGGLRFAVERMKQVVEPAGAAALAAVLYGLVPIEAGERVCVVASGGNVEVSRLGELIAAARPLPTAG